MRGRRLLRKHLAARHLMPEAWPLVTSVYPTRILALQRSAGVQKPGVLRPWMSLVPRPSFHRTRTSRGRYELIRQGRVAIDSITFVSTSPKIISTSLCSQWRDVHYGAQRGRAGGADGRALLAGPLLVVLEATGGFVTVAAAALAAARLQVIIVDPSQVRALTEAIGQRAKTERSMPAFIARFAEGDAARAAATTGPRPLRLLTDLVTRIRRIIDMIGTEQRRQKRAQARLEKRSQARPGAGKETDPSVDRRHRRCRARFAPAWRRDGGPARPPVPGIGSAVARTLITELPGARRSTSGGRRAGRSCPAPASIGPVEEGAKLHQQ